MEEDSPTGDSPTSPKSPRRARGRPRREAIERENLATMLKSNLSNDVSKRFLQKMNLLKRKRKLKLKSFNYDEYLSKYLRSSAPLVALHREHVETGDNYENQMALIEQCSRITYTPYQHSFASRLNGLIQPPLSKSNPSYIRREYGVYPLGLQLLQEIAFVSRNNADAASGTKSLVRAASPIDFLPLAETHVNQCNALLQRLFWPGISISDCIGYKRGIVALYRKLVVGVGVVTPDGYLMYLAVRPYWEGEGIGKMMLWWLIRENETVDITLHVAADNAAMIMYQSFGFKPEEYIKNFYDKFYEESDRRKRDALFLRLRRG